MTRDSSADRGGDGTCLRRTLKEIEERVQELRQSDPPGGQRAAGRRQGLEDALDEILTDLGDVEQEIHDALSVLAESRSDLRQVTNRRLPNTQAKLAEASSATEMAASDMLDRLEHALELVHGLEDEESGEEEADAPQRAQALSDLEEDLHEIINSLQFQDITAQQIQHVSSVLRETEGRIGRLASALFGEDREEDAWAGSGPGRDGSEDRARSSDGSDGTTFDPGATTEDAPDRQDVADEVFG